MTFLVERLADLRKHLTHLNELRPRVQSGRSLETDLSLHNDLLFSLLMVCQLVIDICGELSTRHGLRFDDYTHAVRNLRRIPGFSETIVAVLEKLPGFRNVLLHDYVAIDLDRAADALRDLDAIEGFVRATADLEAESI